MTDHPANKATDFQAPMADCALAFRKEAGQLAQGRQRQMPDAGRATKVVRALNALHGARDIDAYFGSQPSR